MMREENDPEKRNLLVDQERKRKQYSGSRTKGNRRSCESSSSGHRKRSPYKSLSNEQRLCGLLVAQNAQSDSRNEKKSRWWKKDPCRSEETLKKEDDTCSCVSCALRRIVGSEYACIACLLLLFSISIVAAFCLVYKNVPQANASSQKKKVITTDTTPKFGPGSLGDSDRLKRKIDIINESLMKREGVFGKPHYEDPIRSDPMELPGSSDIDFAPSLRELNLLDGGKTKRHGDSDFSSIMGPIISDQSSDKLKEFYKKLVQTDGMIKSLRKIKFTNHNNEYGTNYDNKSPDRFKRSLKVFTYPKKYRLRRRRRNTYNRIDDSIHESPRNRKLRLKRFYNETDEPTGFVIEKKKLVVQYKPVSFRKLVPNRCSHVPKESHIHHEHQLKHPFYQNTQRLDELLDRFLNKNLPELVSDPFGFDSLFQRDKNKCKHPNPTKNVDVVNVAEETHVTDTKQSTKSKAPNDMKSTKQYEQSTSSSNGTRKAITKNKYGKISKAKEELNKRILYSFDSPEDIKASSSEVSTSPYERKFYEHEAEMLNKEDVTLVSASPSDFELLLSVSTIMNPDIGDTVGVTESEIPLINRVPNIRRLMQTEGEEDENLGYEDLKEVLTDNMENEDDNERKGERKKRKYDAENEINDAGLWFTKLSSILGQPEVEEKAPPPEISVSGEWSSISAKTTPLTITQDVYHKQLQFSPPNSINNPNWKGPMPLYPDELSSMLKEQSNVFKANILNSRMDPKPANRKKRKRTDLEYIKDYLDNKYDRLVEMAQAYSDYGVLEGKKDNVRNEKRPVTNNKLSGDRVKLSADETLDNSDIIAIQKDADSFFYPFCINKDTTSTTSSGGMFRLFSPAPHKVSKPNSEGFRVEMRPTQGIEDSVLSKLLQSHIKMDNAKKISEKVPMAQDPSVYPQTELIYDPKLMETTTEDESKKKFSTEKELNNLFAINKKRALLSTLFRKSDYSIENDDSRRPEMGVYSENNKNSNSEELDKMKILGNSNFEYTRDTKMTNKLKNFFQNKNQHFKYIDTKLNIDNKYSNTDHSIVFLKAEAPMVSPEVKEIMEYMSQVTQNNIRLFSVPYLFSYTQEKSTTEPMTVIDAPNLFSYEANSNVATDLEQSYQITNQLIFNPSDNSPLLTDHTEMNSIDANKTSYLTQLFMSSQQPDQDDVKDQFKIPFNTEFITEPSAVTGMFEETSTMVEDSFQLTNVIRRLKRNVDTAKTMLEKSGVTIHEAPLGLPEVHKNVSVNDSQVISKVPISNDANTTANNTTISDFFMMISDWFKALEGIKVDDKPKQNPSSDLTHLLLQFNDLANETKPQTRSTTTDTVYPLYDSDMIENIGHRSRVLLTIKEDNTTENAARIGVHNNEVIKENSANVSGRENNESSTISTLTVHLNVNQTTPEKQKATVYSVPERDNNTRKKVKRNADDSNLISWNDIYDDEYGIRTDNFNSIKDKYSKEREFIKRSGRWVQNKIKKFADNLKGRDPEVVVKERTSRAAENVGIVKKLKNLYRKSKRQSEEEKYGPDQKTVFNVLQANMVEACRKAAKAVKQTRNADVKGDSDQGTIAASLMQQLVRLLTDVVDYQVEQKTCTQLPPDLKEFLEWLTMPGDEPRDEKTASSLSNESPEAPLYKTTQIYPGADSMEELMKDKHLEYTSTTDNTPSLYKEADFKSQYLEALRSVQELLDQYAEMSDEEKSKMTGVKFYLEDQLRLLNKQVSGYDFYTLYEKTSLPLRYKRGFHPRNLQQRNKRKHYKFVRNFGKKHTRPTAAYYDGIPISEKKKMKEDSDDVVERELSNKRLIVPKRNGRNLKDIYYKAVAEAKKYSTALAKNGHKRQQVHGHTLTTPLNVS